jgi:hypothetical protein
VTAPPFAYFGGKTTSAGRIAAHFHPHRHYVEPYAGSLAVLLAKPPSRMETVNDLDAAVMTFWRVLRDRPDELVRACQLTPHSRAEWESCEELDVVSRRIGDRSTAVGAGEPRAYWTLEELGMASLRIPRCDRDRIPELSGRLRRTHGRSRRATAQGQP